MQAFNLSMLFLHMLGLAALLGGFFSQWRNGSQVVSQLMVAGAGVQVLTGLLLFMGLKIHHDPVDAPKLVVKLVVGLVVAVIAQLGVRRRSSSLFYATGLLALGNVAVAVFWT
jgi:hypothetical protein